jgi:hypothetical protein
VLVLRSFFLKVNFLASCFRKIAGARKRPSFSRLAPPYLFISFIKWIGISLVHRSWNQINNINLSIYLSGSISISKKEPTLKGRNQRKVLTPCPRHSSPTMPPGRKGPPFSFFLQSFRSGQVGWFRPSIYAILCLRSWSCWAKGS